MKVRKFTATVSQLNSLPYMDFDVSFSDSSGNLYFPEAVQYVNDTGCTVGYMYLASDEVDEAFRNPTFYEYLALPTGTTNSDLPAAKFIRIKKTAGTATKDLVFHLIGAISWSTF
jgi:hypothetical protein